MTSAVPQGTWNADRQAGRSTDGQVYNREGKLWLGHEDERGNFIGFEMEKAAAFSKREDFLPAGAACLMLAAEHVDTLLPR